MTSKEFVLQRICIFAGKDIDPDSDKQVEEMLRNKFNIHLPQRSSMNESLAAVNSDHEVLTLIKQYRAFAS
jgi:DNA polymerase I-like protein with 3'-5' exonuclease and polymerase domains